MKRERQAYSRQYYLKHKARIDKNNKLYQLKNWTKVQELCRQYYLKHKNRLLKQHRQYKLDHQDKVRNMNRQYVFNRKKLDINFRLATLLRTRLNNAVRINQKAGSAVKDLGCSVEFLKQYLELKFKKDMTWKNWGHGRNKWNIDHIVPLSRFDLTNRKQFLKACHYTNLQPMWQPENFEKGAKYYE